MNTKIETKKILKMENLCAYKNYCKIAQNYEGLIKEAIKKNDDIELLITKAYYQVECVNNRSTCPEKKIFNKRKLEASL
jgi:hypothetical protein